MKSLDNPRSYDFSRSKIAEASRDKADWASKKIRVKEHHHHKREPNRNTELLKRLPSGIWGSVKPGSITTIC